MKLVKLRYFIVILLINQCISLYAQKEIKQIPIRLVQYMPNMPRPYKMKDWKAIAIKQDRLLYDFNAKGRFLPLIWWDDSQVNFPIRSFELSSYVGSNHNSLKGSYYESLPVIGSLVGASLVGIDKSNQNGIDFVTMARQFFNKSNGVNLVENTVDYIPGKTFWYEIWPTIEQIWDNYNLTREVEACFRVLKTDLNIRPIHHQLDQYIEPHIWLGVVAYQFTRFVRLRLKAKDINYSWSTIVEKMKTQQLSVVSINKKGNSKIYAKLVTRPSIDQQSIYDALGYKHRPFVRKTKVVPQL